MAADPTHVNGPGLDGADIDMLRSLPRQLAATPLRASKTQARDVARRRRLQNWGLLSVQAQQGGVFLVMITEAGVAALNAHAPGRRGAGAA